MGVTVKMVRTGERGVDFSFARPPANRLLELGFSFVVGYISVPPAAPAKNITKAECEFYLAAGLKVLLVWEMSATRASLGAAYGTMDGASAKILAKDIGYPLDIPILAADDTNTTVANIDKQEAYMRAFASAAAPYSIGIYGDTDILARTYGLWRIGWVPVNAWSWSGSSLADAIAKAKAIGAHVLQRKGYYIDNIWAVDPNDAIADFPAWGTGFDPPTPPQGDDDMPIILTNSEIHDGFQPGVVKFAFDGITKRQLSAEYGPLFGAGAPYANPGSPLSNAALAAIPDYAPPGSGTVDQVARDEALHANESVTRIARTISDIRMGGQRIADAGGM